MKSAGTVLQEELPESQRAALLNLLADEDPAIYETVRARILSFGPKASQWLQAYRLSNDPLLRRRSQEIVLYFERQAADNRFLGFCLKHGQELDLEQGAWLLAQTQYPDINVEAYTALLDDIAAELRERISAGGSARKVLAAINQHLFGARGFSGNEENYYEPANSYLNRVLDRRTGNPVSLCLVYILLARRLRLPITGIGLPGHFVCRYQSISDEIYVDAFNRGKLLSKADCVQYLLKGNYSIQDQYLAPVSPRALLLRVCTNLHQIYEELEKPEQTTRLQRYLVALGR